MRVLLKIIQSLEIDPKNSSALKNRGDAKNALDDYKGQLQTILKHLQLDQNTGFVIAKEVLQNGETEISRVLF